MRGKGLYVCDWRCYRRITPAYAGKRSISRSNLPLKRDHPRLCGEKLISLHKSSSERGSPPPMRGKVFFNDFSHGLLRITPAYAGKRWANLVSPLSSRDHPRLCGEKHVSTAILLGSRGSPPPMRGKVGNGMEPDFVHGITPAYAGKSSVLWNREWKRKDHPRLCGEKRCSTKHRSDATGSPPPMRGKVSET